ncbi:hypothetical protein BKA69DRAFT_171059 [Paraphysoderma sedebokerense]|nr:hypothetical protein BKA69DRAFT_171059 [Paraphysoderma sedebokerense]
MSSSSPTPPPLPTDLVLQPSEHALLYRKYLPHYTDSGPSIPNAIELTALQEELLSLSTKASERVKALESEISKIESYISAANPVTSRLDEKTEVEVKEEPMEENEFFKALSVERESSVDLKKDKKRRKSFGVSSTDLGGDAGKLPSSGPSHSTEGEKLIIRLKPAVVGTNSQIPAPLPSASGLSHQRAKIKKERMTPEPPSMLAEKDKVKVEVSSMMSFFLIFTVC